MGGPGGGGGAGRGGRGEGVGRGEGGELWGGGGVILKMIMKHYVAA